MADEWDEEPRPRSADDSMIPSRSLEAFSRKVTATAGHLLGDPSVNQHYHNALGEIHKELRRPMVQRQIFALSQASPRELVRSKLSTSEIQHRALAYLPDELLEDIPDTTSPYSLFQGFQATIPEHDKSKRKRRHGRHSSRGQRLLKDADDDGDAPVPLASLRNEKQSLDHRLEMLNVRKNMCSTEIREIDNKISNLNTMRQVVLDRLTGLEQEEAQLSQDVFDVETRLGTMEEELEDAQALAGQKTPTQDLDAAEEMPDSPGMEASFMSESIYQKLPPSHSKRPKPARRRTHFILHEHLQSGSNLREIQAHSDIVSALDFDAPFGTMVTAALDDTVRVWDLNVGRCIGLLEGHLSSVRCLQVEDNIVATGSMDASVRLWDLSQADYSPPAQAANNRVKKRAEPAEGEADDVPHPPLEEDDEEEDFADAPSTPPPSNMRDCPVFTLSAHVAEVTALHFHNRTLISGSADKTLREWDLVKGRCVQTLDVLWAAAQAQAQVQATSASSASSMSTSWQPQAARSRTADVNADFVGAVQVFDAALACGTADSMVRMWDLRSGQVHRTLVGHTGPVTCLQFDDVHLVTGSYDRSIRIWDLRTGSIVDAFAYDSPITSMMFDARRIVAAAGEGVVKVYDKADARHWDCGTISDGAGANVDEFGVGSVKEPGQGGRRSTVERVRIKDGYLVEGRRDGVVGVWSC